MVISVDVCSLPASPQCAPRRFTAKDHGWFTDRRESTCRSEVKQICVGAALQARDGEEGGGGGGGGKKEKEGR